MKKLWWHNKVAYQIYPKSFYDTNGDGIGDLRGIIEKLDYLKELGIDIIWISPVFESPMLDQGYDISDYYNINPMFGNMDDMDELLHEAKKRGFYILMDLVINHCSYKHKWFQKAMEDLNSKYADYFYIEEGIDNQPPCNWRSYFGGSAWEKIGDTNKYYLHLFDKSQPDLNWENKEVREELYSMVNWWLEKGIDGFRIDAIINIKKQLEFKNYKPDRSDGLSSIHHMLEEAKGVGDYLLELKKETFNKHDAFTVAEVFDNKPGELEKFIGENGYFSTIFDFSIETARTGDNWYDMKILTPEEIKTIITQGQEECSDIGFRANIIENHDEPRGASSYFEVETNCIESTTMLGTISLMLRGIPFLFQGQEIGMKNNTFSSINDVDDVSSKDQYQVALDAGFTEQEALEIVNRRSRDNSRTPFQWNETENAGFTSGNPWLQVNANYREINVANQENDPNSVLSFYKRLIQLRKNAKFEDALVYGTYEATLVEQKNILAFYRRGKENTILVVANYQVENQSVKLQDDIKEILLSNGKKIDIQNGILTLEKYQVGVFLI